MKMNQSKMGKLIKKIRKEKGLTQAELADKLNLSCKTISKWECGNGCPDISVLKELSEILDISISELLSGELGDKKEIDSAQCVVKLDGGCYLYGLALFVCVGWGAR